MSRFTETSVPQGIDFEELTPDAVLSHLADVDCLPTYKKLLEKMGKYVTEEDLLADRIAQARLDVVMSLYSKKTKSDRETPVVILRTRREQQGGPVSAIETGRFRLAGDEFSYFIPEYWPAEPTNLPKEKLWIPNYLREEDVVPERLYQHAYVAVDRPFTKTLHRVRVGGRYRGATQRYNYRKGAWEAVRQRRFGGTTNKRYRAYIGNQEPLPRR